MIQSKVITFLLLAGSAPLALLGSIWQEETGSDGVPPFGDVYATAMDGIAWHPQLGWMIAHGDSFEDGSWVLRLPHNDLSIPGGVGDPQYFWVSTGSWPWLWMQEPQEWAYFVEDSHPPQFWGESTGWYHDFSEGTLTDAYLSGSQEKLEAVLDRWAATPSITDQEFEQLPDVLQDVYLIYEDFFTPQNPGRVDDRASSLELPDYVVTKTPYIRLGAQGHLLIDSFRPRLPNIDAKVIHNRYDDLLEFITSDLSGRRNFNRVEFLRGSLTVLEGWSHCPGTFPLVEGIEFNNDRTTATVQWSACGYGGTAEYVKEAGQWVFISSEFGWVS